MTVHSAEALQDKLDSELGWRLRELDAHRSLVRLSTAATRRMLLRAGVALLYAHWEGFVKAAGQLYIRFVESRGLNYGDLSISFAAIGLKAELNLLRSTNKAQLLIEAAEIILGSTDRAATLQSNVIKTSNLRSEPLLHILAALGLNPTPYESKFTLINESLVDRRNSIAHGDYLDIDVQDFIDLSDQIISLMRIYKTDIENAVALKAYRR